MSARKSSKKVSIVRPRIDEYMTMKTTLLLIAAGLAAACVELRAETHRFTPTQFYNTWSAAHPPALRIKPGDRVVTKTIDAGGVDWNGKTVAMGPNPQTGPFYIEGAEPGDVLVVTLEKIETNRTMAYSASLLSPYATTPQAIGARTDREARRLTWTIDKAKGVARLDQNEVQPGGIELPLRPMLGCVGVAPRGKEAIATSTPGAWGGNMDYASMNAGVKLMLPVNEPGALLFLGDGHARQGEGEVAGTGLETSMDVEFTVDLVKKKTIGWPRLENQTHIMVLGSARPLLEAFQIATAELQRWLMTDYGMTERGAQTFMGQAAEYEIANVVDPSFTVVAKIRKDVLPRR
jgi:acetamidase/formamidase